MGAAALAFSTRGPGPAGCRIRPPPNPNLAAERSPQCPLPPTPEKILQTGLAFWPSKTLLKWGQSL